MGQVLNRSPSPKGLNPQTQQKTYWQLTPHYFSPSHKLKRSSLFGLQQNYTFCEQFQIKICQFAINPDSDIAEVNAILRKIAVVPVATTPEKILWSTLLLKTPPERNTSTNQQFQWLLASRVFPRPMGKSLHHNNP